MLPVVCALGISGDFKMSGRLPERPLAPLDAELSRHGIRLRRSDPNTLCCEGQLAAGEYILPGNISSQYISGLLFALPLLEETSTLTVTAPIESADYIAMTIQVLRLFAKDFTQRHRTFGSGDMEEEDDDEEEKNLKFKFNELTSIKDLELDEELSDNSLMLRGCPISKNSTTEYTEFHGEKDRKLIKTPCNSASSVVEYSFCISPTHLCEKKINHSLLVEGDWSNAAFWLCAGAMPGGNIEMSGLDRESVQGDREICAILKQMGACLEWAGDVLHISEGKRLGAQIDARAIPDLVPVLCAVAAVSSGETVIKNAGRLRLKESDRLTAVAQTLNALGAKITEEPDGLRIQGVHRLKGGTVDAWGDHRIAMMAAVASLACESAVTITGGQAVNKSYPAFWEKFRALGKEVIINE
jgi:5-enolpyruvylshikimate-3-phosphate synthase